MSVTQTAIRVHGLKSRAKGCTSCAAWTSTWRGAAFFALLGAYKPYSPRPRQCR
jgi:hypothetical protein